MKKFIAGFIIGAGITSIAVFGAGKIVSAEYNTTSVIYDGNQLTLSQPLISVQEEGVNGIYNYMPVRAVLEQMGYTVDWDGPNNAVRISSPGQAATPTPTPQPTSDPVKQPEDETPSGNIPALYGEGEHTVSRALHNINRMSIESAYGRQYVIKDSTTVTCDGKTIAWKDVQTGWQINFETASDSLDVISIDVVRTVPDTTTGDKQNVTLDSVYDNLLRVKVGRKDYNVADYCNITVNGEKATLSDIDAGSKAEIIINRHDTIVSITVQ